MKYFRETNVLGGPRRPGAVVPWSTSGAAPGGFSRGVRRGTPRTETATRGRTPRLETAARGGIPRMEEREPKAPAVGRFCRSSALGGPCLRMASVFALLSAVGCSWFSWVPGIGGGDKAEDTDKPAPLVEFVEEADVVRLWQASVGKGLGRKYLRLSPAILADRIYAADAYGTVAAFDRFTGRNAWRTSIGRPDSRSGLKFWDRRDPSFVTGGVGAAGGRVLVGTTPGRGRCAGRGEWVPRVAVRSQQRSAGAPGRWRGPRRRADRGWPGFRPERHRWHAALELRHPAADPDPARHRGPRAARRACLCRFRYRQGGGVPRPRTARPCGSSA